MKRLLPGATIGMLGGGQLGRMFTMEARRMGYRVHVFTDKPNSPTAQISDLATVAPYEDIDAIAKFAKSVDAVTYEFENIPAPTVQKLEENVPAHPSSKVLFTTQHRLREKTFLADCGLPLPRWRAIRTAEDLQPALDYTGAPAILKTAGFGYDGKGQADIDNFEDLQKAWDNLGRTEAVLEQKISFDCEVSMVVARNAAGEFAHYNLVQNEHWHHILHTTQAPADVPQKLHHQAAEITRTICESLDVVGNICVEFFRRGDELLVNEIAPRPHNSGHLTIEACITSQFGQQLRTVCGFAPGPTDFVRPAVMINLLGDLWNNGSPDWEKVLLQPGMHLHLYGKSEARPGRKMGHMTILGKTPELARQAAENVYRQLAQDAGIG